MSVLRVWDVLLFDGNRVMLFQTALALLEIYGTGIRLIGHSIQSENDSNTWTESRVMFLLIAGPSLMDTKHACDAVALLRSLASSTFDSNQLVLKACEGYQSVSETGLQELRKKYKSSVIASVEEMARNADKMSNVANTDADKVTISIIERFLIPYNFFLHSMTISSFIFLNMTSSRTPQVVSLI
jgi:Tat protein secretion system quality control protein TatD with DNase activity